MSTANIPFLAFHLLVLLFSVVIHEVAHGTVALMLGDPTAKYAGRLTLNPLKHIDPFGTVILPLLLLSFSIFSGMGLALFGWAKPVPYNPAHLRNPRKGAAIISLAGPAANMLIAVIFGLLIRTLSSGAFVPSGYMQTLLGAFAAIVFTNLYLALFNLIPVPPLDGSKLFVAFLPAGQWMQITHFMEQWGIFLLVFVIYYFVPYVSLVASFIFRLLVGVSAVGS